MLAISSRFSGKFPSTNRVFRMCRKGYWQRLEWLVGHVLERVDTMLRKWDVKTIKRWVQRVLQVP